MPADEYANGTRLWRTLVSSWEMGRRPRRMHGVIVRYRLGSTVDAARAMFGDDTPQLMRLPRDLVPARKAGPTDDMSLPVAPSVTFGTRVKGWYNAVDDGRERAIPVWLDTSPRPDHVPVMVAPTSQVTRSCRRGPTRCSSTRRTMTAGSWRADSNSAELPERYD